jgi:hypothetical protein
MHKQKIISILILWIFLVTLTWCTKKTWNTTINENIYDWENTTIIDTTTSEEEIWNESIEEINNEITSQENEANEENTNITEKWTYEYESKLDKFSIQVPNDWSFEENKYGFSVIAYTPDDWEVRENLWVLIQTPQINTNLEEYYQESIKKIDEISEWFKEIKTSDIEINWLKGKNTIYETIQNNTNIKSQQTVFIKDNIVYVLQYTATKETFDKYINDVNNIIKSFTLKN